MRRGFQVMTPAEDLRRRHQKAGYGNLTLEEKQWLELDKILHPDK